jgi:hypothetical protein
MFRAFTVPIIRNYQPYTWQLVCFMQVMWPLPRRVRLELSSNLTKYKFGYLMHLAGYLYEDYHDARPLEHKVHKNNRCLFSHINTLCRQNVEFLNVKSGGTYSDHWALEG